MGEACTMREIDEIEFFNLSDPFMKAAFDEIESDDPLFKLQIAAAVYDDKIAPVHFPIYVGDTYSEKIIIFTRKQCFDTYYEYIKGGKK